MLFAEAPTPNANTVWIVLLALASFGANLATILAVVASNRKQKREVGFEFVPASKEEFDKHVLSNSVDHDKIFSKIGGVERGAASSIEAKVEVVRKDVGSVGLKVAGLEATTNIQNQSLAAIQSDVKRLLERGRS